MASNFVINRRNVHFFEAIPRWTMFVDPGPTTGYVRVDGISPQSGHPYVQHYTPVSVSAERAQDRFAEFCVRAHKYGQVPKLVIEEYRIYPGKEKIHVGKEVITSEIIGGFTYLARRLRAEVTKIPAQVKQTTQGMCDGRGVYLIGGDDHQRDAELLMWYTAFRIESTKKVGAQ